MVVTAFTFVQAHHSCMSLCRCVRAFTLKHSVCCRCTAQWFRVGVWALRVWPCAGAVVPDPPCFLPSPTSLVLRMAFCQIPALFENSGLWSRLWYWDGRRSSGQHLPLRGSEPVCGVGFPSSNWLCNQRHCFFGSPHLFSLFSILFLSILLFSLLFSSALSALSALSSLLVFTSFLLFFSSLPPVPYSLIFSSLRFLLSSPLLLLLDIFSSRHEIDG